MAFAYGGFSALDPGRVLDACTAQKLPTDWFGTANMWMTTLGPFAAKAWLLMRRGDIASLNTEVAYPLVITDDNLGNSATIAEMYFFRARCVTPGVLGDTSAAYLVELVDARHLVKNDYYAVPTYAQYNVRAPAGGSFTYYAESLNGGNPFGWQDMLDDLWNTEIAMQLVLGTSPQLPFVPDGTPEDFRFVGVPAWDAYNSILRRLGCALTCDPSQGSGDPTLQKFNIVQVGAIDANEAAAESVYFLRRALDDDPIESSIAKVPASLDVAFHIIAQNYGTEKTTQPGNGQWTQNAVHVETVINVNGGVGKALVWDDLACIVDINGTILNQAALTSRAQQRAADYERQIGTQGARMRRSYIGVVADPRFLPGAQITGYAIRDRGNGTMTDIWRVPRMSDRPAEFLPEGVAQVNEWLHAPDFGRATVPNYPPYDQPILLGSITSMTGFYNGTVQLIPPGGSPVNAESCYVMALNSATFTPGNTVLGRINGSLTIGGTTLPLYLATGGINGSFLACSSDGSHSVTVTVIDGQIVGIV